MLIEIPANEAQGSTLRGNVGDPELQNAFKSFLKKKKKLKKKAKASSRKYTKQRAESSVFRDKLRKKFAERIRHYIGVPYGKRFHSAENCDCEGCIESGRQLYHDAMHLDCCALIRKAVADLRHFFGFRLGRWNQSYQFDTLPIRVGSVEQLEPGDLIFWAGDYMKEGMKKQVFDMTHVEVFIGGETGKAVIGSRWKYKWVTEYDTYEFTSLSWVCKEIYFVKIDTWLRGIQQPAHPEYWKVSSKPSPGKKSIFNVDSPAGKPLLSDDRENEGDADLEALKDLDLEEIPSDSSNSDEEEAEGAQEPADGAKDSSAPADQEDGAAAEGETSFKS